MSSSALGSRRRRLALSVGGALAAAIIAAPSASAQFTLAPCQGSLAPGQGATFQNNAFNGFQDVFAQEPPVGCGSAARNLVAWNGTGSGDGRRALGERGSANPNGNRHATDRWAGADEPPNAAQRLQIEAGPTDGNGQDLTAADNGKLHVIPVAIGAIAALVHLPDGCTSFGSGAALYQERPKIALADLESAWAGEPTVWGDLIPTLEPNDATCRTAPVKRVVRFDSSGTTFAFKQLLANINPARTDWNTLGNQAWPNDDGATETTNGGANGGGALVTKLDATSGGIGYVDLATARRQVNGAFQYDGSLAFDTKFWLPLQRVPATDVWDDPQADVNGYKQGSAARGANCAGVTPSGIPTSPAADPTYGDWSQTDSTLSHDGYAACTLTYDMAFDDNAVVYCNSAAEQAKARTIKDYLSTVVSNAGQASLPANDYARLPGSVLGISVAAVNAIDWNKGGQGRPCSDQPAPTPTPTATPTGPGTPPPPDTTPPPPPVAPSNAFTISSARVSGTTVRLQLQLPGAGRVSVASTTKPKKGKRIKLATKSANVSQAGRTTISLSLSAKAKKALRKDKRLKIAMKVTFTPTGGAAKTVNKSVTVKQPKAKKKSKGKSRS